MPNSAGLSRAPKADADAGGPAAAGDFALGLNALTPENDDLRERLKGAQDREDLLRHELQHRVRNLLSSIRSVFRQSREVGASQEEFAEHFEGRLETIARFHAGGLSDHDTGVELEDIVREELLKVHCAESGACTIDGGSARLHGRTLELIGLAIHELTTNALKFGALGGNGGLAVSWSCDAVGDGQGLVHFRWIETGVAMLSLAPRPSGFGRQLLEDAIPYELDATASFELKPGGLAFSLNFPLPGARTPLPRFSTDDLFAGSFEG